MTLISDHELVYCTRKKLKGKKVEFVWIRTYHRFNQLAFLCDVHRASWQSVYDGTDVNAAAAIFNKIFTNIVNKHAPFKWVKYKGSRPAWVTDELLGLIDNRTHCIRRFKRNATAENWWAKQNAINEVNVLKKVLQQEHVQKNTK